MNAYIFDKSTVNIGKPSVMGTYGEEEVNGLKGKLFPLEISDYGTVNAPADNWYTFVTMPIKTKLYGLATRLIGMYWEQGCGMVVPINDKEYVIAVSEYKKPILSLDNGVLSCAIIGTPGVWTTDINLDEWTEGEDSGLIKKIKCFYKL